MSYPSNVHSSIRVDKDRRITDICCCGLGVLFGLILFILGCVLLNKANLTHANFPTDS